MARYRITSPDGKQTIEVEGPDDATQQELEQFTRQQFGGKFASSPVDIRPPEVQPEAALASDIGEGVGAIGGGFAEGVGNVIDHAGGWARSGLDAAGNLFGMGNLGTRAGNAISDLNQWGAENLGTRDPNAAVPEDLSTLRGIGRFAGEAVATAPIAGVRGGAAVQGALGGALLSNADTPWGIAGDAALGAVGARVGQGLLGNAAEVVAPRVSNDARTLANEGVRLTPGAIAGEGSYTKRLEDIAAGVPVAGTPVNAAQRQANTDLSRAAANRALRPIGERLPRNIDVGHDSVRYAGDRLSQAYGDVLPRLNGNSDATFGRRVQAIIGRADLPEQNQGDLANLVRETFKAFRPVNPRTGVDVPITAEQFSQLPATEWAYNGRRLRDASERLGDMAAAYRASDNPYNRQLGDVADQLRAQLHSLARRGNPADSQRLRDIDRGYASLVRLERAAAGTADGIPTPAQYDAGVRGADSSARRRQSARGRALDQDLSGAARRVMQNTAAQGGSRDINAIALLGALGTGVLDMKGGALTGLAAIGAARGAYSPGAQEVIRNIMLRNPGVGAQGAAALLRGGAAVAPVAAPAAIDEFRR